MPRRSRARSNGLHPAVGSVPEASATTDTTEMPAAESVPEASGVTSTTETPAAESVPAPKRTPKRTSKRTPKPSGVNGTESTVTESGVPEPSVAAPREVIPVEAKIPVTLRPWSGGDLPLLGRLMGDPAMTVYLGGPESAKELRERHVRYCNIEPEHGAMYVILAGENEKVAGSVGYWETEAQEQMVWETGWSVLPEFQGLGVASKAAEMMIEQARTRRKHRTLHAYPLVENAASNGVCRKAGFTLQGEVVLEDWRATGKLLRYNDWCIDLFG